jgi:hypothetical protein
VSLPADWPDPVRAADAGKPDAGALPLGARPWHIGVRGRLSASGEEKPPAVPLAVTLAPFAQPAREAVRERVALVQGYPAFDGPLARYALRRRGFDVDLFDRRWLDPAEYGPYRAVVIVGDLVRAKTQPPRYGKDDLARVRQYLEGGGTLLLMRKGADVFASPEGRTALADLAGTCPPEKKPELKLLRRDHPWVKHLRRDTPHPWVADRLALPLRTGKGERVIGSAAGYATLHWVAVGRGQLIYLGWEISASLPALKGTVEDERRFEDQTSILAAIVGGL